MKLTCILRTATRTSHIKCVEEMVSLLGYQPPRWASKLRNVPKNYIDLAHKPTPIQEWNLSDVPHDFKLNVKRDDLTGHLLSGNKIRKLEFIFADAVRKKSSCIITCGSMQSNHCRASAIVAKQLGLGCHLLLRSHNQEEDAKSISANILLCRMHGAKSYAVPYESLEGGLSARLYKLADELEKQGERPYVISLGGSDYLGTFGIINSFSELMSQGLLSNYDDIVVATSSGGTLAGLAIANYLTGERLRVHGVSGSGNDKYFYQHVEDTLTEYGLTRGKANQICDVIDGSKGEYDSGRDLDAVVKVCKESGIVMDHSYTLKAVKGMLRELKDNPKRFKGNRILYIHTGGTFSLFDGLSTSVHHSDNIRIWKNIDDNPLQT